MMKSLNRSHNKYLVTAILAFVCLLLTANMAIAQTTDFEIPQPSGDAVNDFAGVIDAASKQDLENTLINLKNQEKIEFAVVTVKTTGGRDIFDYALAIGRRWGVGPSNDEKQGLVLLVAIDDRKYQTLVSRHLQGELTDGTVGSIQRQYLVPAFRAGRYGEGLTDTVRAYIDTLASKRGFSTAGIYQSTRPSTRPTPSRPRDAGSGSSICGLIVIILIVFLFLAASRGRGGGGGCLNALLLGSLLSNITRGGSSSGWSGGGFGGSSGGDGGGFGGFGGGGDFDGGGAGGSW